MKRQKAGEINVLKRIMYLLEEGSVSHLIEQDEVFENFVGQLYGTLSQEAMRLQRH